MGILLAKFKKEKTTAEKLESLEERIVEIEKYSFNTQEQKKRFVGSFLAISIGIYVVVSLVFYFVWLPPTWKERIFYSVPLLLFPFVIIILRKILTWYFQRKLNKNSNTLSQLRTQKKKILEQVMDKETYKVAVNLLNRFGDKTIVGMRPPTIAGVNQGATPRGTAAATAAAMNVPAQLSAAQSSVASMRTLAATGGGGGASHQQSATVATKSSDTMPLLSPSSQWASVERSPSMRLAAGVPSSPHDGQQLRRRTPFPIINQQQKSFFDRIIDVLIGDGPQDRFAMICNKCYVHNGMALKEDFDYVTFRCAFCNALNPSRKSRPVAPLLPMQQADNAARSLMLRGSSESSSSSSSTEDNATMDHGDYTKSEGNVEAEVSALKREEEEGGGSSVNEATSSVNDASSEDHRTGEDAIEEAGTTSDC